MSLGAPQLSTDAVERLARLLCRGRAVLLADVSVGAWTPAVRSEDCPAFAVLTMQGTPLAFAHDAYEAAVLALRLDGDGEIPRALRQALADRPLEARTEARLAAEASLDLASSRESMHTAADWWLYCRRGCPKDWRWIRQIAQGLTVADLQAGAR